MFIVFPPSQISHSYGNLLLHDARNGSGQYVHQFDAGATNVESEMVCDRGRTYQAT